MRRGRKYSFTRLRVCIYRPTELDRIGRVEVVIYRKLGGDFGSASVGRWLIGRDARLAGRPAGWVVTALGPVPQVDINAGARTSSSSSSTPAAPTSLRLGLRSKPPAFAAAAAAAAGDPNDDCRSRACRTKRRSNELIIRWLRPATNAKLIVLAGRSTRC